MSKGTSCGEAMQIWEEKNKIPLGEAKDVNLCFQLPPILKMDNSLAQLMKCEKLSLSSNQIDKITGVGSLKNLKILSLGRNQIKSLSGIEALGATLQELWISYNFIVKLKGIQAMKKMSVFYISHNLINSWKEVDRLLECQNLQDLVLVGNPIVDGMEEKQAQKEVTHRLPQLEKFDGDPIIKDQ